MSTYTYAKIVSASRLTQEINECGITVALDHIATSSTGSDIVFKATLSQSEQETLNNLVEDHDPADLATREEVVVMVQNVKSGALEAQKTPIMARDGKMRVLASHKPVIPGKETYSYFTSRGDAGRVVGSGTALQLSTTPGQEFSYVDVHLGSDLDPFEQVYIFGGGVFWENAGWGDEVSLELRTLPTVTIPAVVASGLGLPVIYNLDGERIRYVGAGQGSHALGGHPKWVPNFTKTGYWDLDKTNLVAVPSVSGTGEFDWYTTEQFVGHYLHNLLVYRNNEYAVLIDATEAAPLPYGTYLRMVAHNVSNTVWRVWAFMKLYRERLK